jgi:dipeptidase E
MKLLLTSSGISNPSINDALVEMLGKPIAESSALFVPTRSGRRTRCSFGAVIPCTCRTG